MLYLIGFMGVGKTTIGKELALEHNLKFIDTDKEIETRNNKKISDIFQEKGQNYFRKLEKEFLISLSGNKVVSCGGGLPVYNNNMCFIKHSGISIYLKASTEKIFNRLSSNSSNRPLIKNRSNNALRKFIKEELTRREKFYLMANHTINTDELSEKDILRKINALIISI